MSSEESDNSDFVDVQGSFANPRPWQLAIRELHATAGSLRFWTGLAAVVLVLAVAAPFDTGTHFTFSTLLVYWGAIAVGTFFLALTTFVLVSNWFWQTGLPVMLGRLVGGVIAGLSVTLLVVAFNLVFFDIDPTADHGQIGFLLKCTLITMAILTIFRLVESDAGISSRCDNSSAEVVEVAEVAEVAELPIEDKDASTGILDSIELAATTQATIPRTPLHQRLSARLGDDIVSLQAQDHYVDVTTTVGHELILMRLVDAEREVQALSGLRVHRSWWIAQDHINVIKRVGGRVMVLLDTGAEVPVSRSRASVLRKVLAARGLDGT